MLMETAENQLHLNPSMLSHPKPAAKVKKRGLNKLLGLRRALVIAKRKLYCGLLGMDIHPTAEFSLSAHFDKTFPIGVHLGRKSYVAFNATILAHDRTRGLYLHTRVGENCFVGARSMIMPGLSIGDGSIVGAGAVVTKDVPPGSMVVGNPARIIASGIKVGHFGRLLTADATQSRLAHAGLA